MGLRLTMICHQCSPPTELQAIIHVRLNINLFSFNFIHALILWSVFDRFLFLYVHLSPIILGVFLAFMAFCSGLVSRELWNQNILIFGFDGQWNYSTSINVLFLRYLFFMGSLTWRTWKYMVQWISQYLKHEDSVSLHPHLCKHFLHP